MGLVMKKIPVNRGDGHSAGDFPVMSILIAGAVILLWRSPLSAMWTPRPRGQCPCCTCSGPEERKTETGTEVSPASGSRRPADRPHNA